MNGGRSPLSTAAVAAASGYSVQQVRTLEERGVIATATRAANGYRQYSPEHVAALGAYRDLATAVGPVEARAAMREAHLGPRDRAAARMCSLHVLLRDERDQALAARDALAAIGAEAATDDEPRETDSLTITELAEALGVRSSTLRFWELSGLIAPERTDTPSGPARRYPPAAVREARVVVALRAGGYRIPDVRRAIDALRGLGDTEPSLAALDARLDAIARRSLALLRAGSAVAAIIESAPS